MNPVELEQIDVEEIIHNFSYTNLETNKISFDRLKLYFKGAKHKRLFRFG